MYMDILGKIICQIINSQYSLPSVSQRIQINIFPKLSNYFLNSSQGCIYSKDTQYNYKEITWNHLIFVSCLTSNEDIFYLFLEEKKK